jgi:transcriptional regulator with XRE-family HTH domain
MSCGPVAKKTRNYPTNMGEDRAMASKRDMERSASTDPERDFLAQRLKEAREYLGLSQDYVSQQTRIPRPAISEVEAGRRRVESLELKRLAALYGRPIGYFLPADEVEASAAAVGGSQASGEDQTELKLRGLTRDLPTEDREEIVRFAEYLRHKKLASQSSRSPGGR